MTMSEHETKQARDTALLALDAYLGRARELAKAKRQAQRKRRYADAHLPDSGNGIARQMRDDAYQALRRASDALWEHLQYGGGHLGYLADIVTKADAEQEGGDAE